MDLPSTELSLCAGIGGLTLGLRRAVVGLRTVCYVERDAYAAAVLVARMEKADLDRAPVWDDLAAFDGKPWRGRVDLVSGGTPCQDLSAAGKQAGLDGERSGLFWEYIRVVKEVQPRFVFWENVASGATGRALPRVVGAFEEAGYMVAEGPDGRPYVVLGADDVGAPHRRLRVFVLAYADNSELRQQPRGCSGESGSGAALAGFFGSDLAYPHSATSGGLGRLRDGERAAHRDNARGRGGELPPFPPGPGDSAGWAAVLERWPGLAPAQPLLRGMVDGLPAWVDGTRADRLRCLGNAAVPAQVALAWRLLWGGIR